MATDIISIPEIKPAAPKVIIENIPDDLKKVDRWVCWKYEGRDGKWTKPPVKLDGKYANINNSGDWLSFEDALAIYQNSGNADGVGFVICEDSNIVGIDLDDCIDENGNKSELAIKILNRLPSYAELSPSGKGIRIFAYGKLPKSSAVSHALGFEMYSGGRYLTITGNTINDYPIADCAAELSELFEELFEAEDEEGTDGLENWVPLTIDQAIMEKLEDLRHDNNTFDKSFDSVESDRSKQEYYLCKTMAKAGFEAGEIFAAMEFRDKGKWHERGIEYKQKLINKIFSKLSNNKVGRPSIGTLLVDLIVDSGAILWHDKNGDGFITINVDKHKENHRINSKRIKNEMSRLYYKQVGKSADSRSITNAVDTLTGIAIHEGNTHEAFIRCAEHDGKFYVDLGDEEWHVIEITGDGWKVIDESPVMFIRSNCSQALPMPERGGTWVDLDKIVNIKNPQDRILAIGWMMQAFWPRGSYTLLNLCGEQGSSKSTTQRFIKNLMDPSITDLRRPPKDERDLMIAVQSERLLSLENLSGMPEHLSDAVCSILTGGTISHRTLYTDGDQFVMKAKNPMICNGIDILTHRADLLDRTIAVELSPIAPHERKTEAELNKIYEEVRPKVLGLLLDATVAGLHNLGNVKLDKLPRMADFCQWVTACESALPWGAGEFANTYFKYIDEQAVSIADSDPVASAIVLLIKCSSERCFVGTATELLEELERLVGQDRRGKDWPRSPNKMSDKLRRIAPSLRASGYEVTEERNRKQRVKCIRYTGQMALV
jgi:hypothetical protein